MRKIGAEIASGIAIVMAIIMFIFGFLYLKNVTLATDSYVVYANFQDVTGLEQSDFVNVSGLRKGRVKELILEGLHVRVALEIEADVLLPKDSEAQIKSLGMVGEKFIEIVQGKSSELLSDGDMLAGTNTRDLADLGGSVEGVMDDAQLFLAELRETFQLLFDDATRADLKQSLANLSAITATLNDNSSHLKSTLTSLESIAMNVDEILTQRRPKVESSIDNLHEVSTRLREFTDKIDSSLTSVNTMLTRIEKQEGTLGKVIYRDDLYDDLRHLTTEMDSLVQDFKKRPQKYLNLGFIKVF